VSTITVFHNVSRDASFGLNQVFDLDGKFHEPHSHELVKVFEFEVSDLFTPEDAAMASLTDEIVADIIFRAFNVGHEPGYGTPGTKEFELATKYRARKLRSLSVGDVLVFDYETYLACESAGWKVVDQGELRVLTTRSAKRLVRERYGFEPAEELSVTVPLEG